MPGRLASALVSALSGRPPLADGGWTRVDTWRPGVEGAVAMTGHAFVAVDPEIDDAALDALGVDGLGGATSARVAAHLAGSGYIECLDVLLGITVPGECLGEPLVPRPDLGSRPRVRLARSLRSDVTVLGRADRGIDDLVTVGAGIGGLTELGIEVAHPGRGVGAALVRSALATLPVGSPVLAACSPGNVRALRTFLSVGFVPLGGVQLWCPHRDSGVTGYGA